MHHASDALAAMIEFVGARAGSNTQLTWAGVLVIAALAWAAGAVNALGYLLLGGVFTSHMTGNTSGALLALATGRGRAPLGLLVALSGFFGGGLAGAFLIETHPEQSSTRALWLEALMLAAAAAVTWQPASMLRGRDLVLAGIAAAMGLQNIALAGSALSAHTTHITGPITDFAGTLARRMIGRRSLARDVSHGLWVYGGRVLAFAVGVVSGALLFQWAGPRALLVPCVAVAAMGTLLWHSARPRHGRPALQTQDLDG